MVPSVAFRSTTRGAGCSDDCCAWGALAAAALFVPCPTAVPVKMGTANSKKTRIGFIRMTLLNLLELVEAWIFQASDVPPDGTIRVSVRPADRRVPRAAPEYSKQAERR